MPRKKNYTYDEIRAHLNTLIEQMDTTWKVLTIEVFSDDSSVTLIDIKDNKIAQFNSMAEFMRCTSYEEAITKYKYPKL